MVDTADANDAPPDDVDIVPIGPGEAAAMAPIATHGSSQGVPGFQRFEPSLV